jgi:peptide-methionine (S)-S-oxide reductase
MCFLHAESTNQMCQGPDRGSSYRSIAFYKNSTEKKIIEDKIKDLTAKKYLLINRH